MIFSIVATHYEPTMTEDEYYRFLDSIEGSESKDVAIELIVMHDGPTTWDYKALHTPYTFPITLISTKTRHGHWGHPLRSEGMKKSVGHYILNTNTDNEYEQGLFAKLNSIVKIAEPNILVGTVEMIGLDTTGTTLFYDTPRDLSKSIVLKGLPLVLGNVDMMQACIKRSVWEAYGWWKDHREQSDGMMFEEMGKQYVYDNIDLSFGKHY